MTLHNDFYYKVMNKTMNGELADHFNTFDDAARAREEAKQKQIKAGFTPDERIIVLVKWERCLDENGVFLSENTVIARILE